MFLSFSAAPRGITPVQRVSLSLSLALIYTPGCVYDACVWLWPECCWGTGQERTAGEVIEEEAAKGGREREERGARVLRRRPPDADWASRNFRACNYP